MERRNGCSCITQKDCTDLCYKSCRSYSFCEADTMVARVRLCQGREFTGCFPVKFTAVYDHTTDGCSMSTDEFCCGMNNDICTVLDRSYQIRCCKCIIHYQRNLMCMCDLCACSRYPLHQSSDFQEFRYRCAFVLS